VNKKTITYLNKMKKDGEKISMLTSYDSSFTKILERADIDAILVGDSLGMVIQGQETTIPVTIEQIIYHTKCVSDVAERALIISDMPFLSYCTKELALENAGKLIKEGGAHMVKLEGGDDQVNIIQHLTRCSIPVCAHLGFLPQSIHKLGGYSLAGKTTKEAEKLLSDANALQDAGAQILVLECVPSKLAEKITNSLEIPVIGIGAGKETDGQVLVLYDALGISINKIPKFARNFLKEADGDIHSAILAYVLAVRQKKFPNSENILA
tara:strand:+ start:132 stop:932 length:801 start_codon:yes stop_codon:yes gene_type:complete